ncbi:hypothetical protein B0T26DRAFT_756982 [Lasiosphaeria miniovina]|uniref:Uncharacterized protein n=1 Tax=Lasiosphaeria miniovina TaxID=1954250 RepID=A0AA39ZTS3_9PEZI|nr:uncharacterized protein B0T26DRAFT_756982 [Lasiosphaeria miniovina]KAK0703425.1 hypothetical protein B0T26DRAFT_756982 [Lasiosphaeria miniovina]
MISVGEERFCGFLTAARREYDSVAEPVDPDEFLKTCHAPTSKSYLHWRCKYSRIKKELSIVTYWKVLCMLYADKCATVSNEVPQWIPIVLVAEFVLDSSIKNESGLYVGDLDQICTTIGWSTRKSWLTSASMNVEFHVFPPAPGSQRARIGMVVTLRRTKRIAGRSRPKKFGFHEEDTLLRDPILYMESLAFAEGAFESDFQSPDDIYNLGQPRLILPWKKKWRDRPIFGDIQGRGKNVTISLDRPFSYTKGRKLLIKLGQA